MEAQALAYVTRGDTVESIHRGHVIVIDGLRNIIAQAGEPETVTYFRSACKAFQALPCITSGAADRFEFTEREIALACASHSGERIHTSIVAGMLDKIGLTERNLRCGVHLPFDDAEAERMLQAGEVPTQLHNNCSGKHAAMLAFAEHLNADIRTYERPDSPVQDAILDAVAKFTEVSTDNIKIGIDGCAAPNFALSISAMATSFINLINPPAVFTESEINACGRVVSAMVNHPELIGGTNRLDTILMQTAPGTLISKVGADGVWLCAVLPNEQWHDGLAIALKIEDGDDKRARPVVAVDLLRKLGVLAADDLQDVSPMLINNRRGDIVGRVDAAEIIGSRQNPRA